MSSCHIQLHDNIYQTGHVNPNPILAISGVQLKYDFVNCLTEFNKRAGTIKSKDNFLKFQAVNGGDLHITNEKDQNLSDNKSITIDKSHLRGFTDIIKLAQEFTNYLYRVSSLKTDALEHVASNIHAIDITNPSAFKQGIINLYHAYTNGDTLKIPHDHVIDNSFYQLITFYLCDQDYYEVPDL